VDAAGEKRLVAYVTSKNGPLAPSELREFIRTKLPAYMVPSRLVFLDQFPLTPNGKIDRSLLPAPENAIERSRHFAAPGTPNEQRIADVWRDVLLLREIGIHDNFFELGGDSLSATRAFARINNAFGVRLTLRDFFEHPTIAGLAGLLPEGFVAPAAPTPIPRQPRVKQEVGFDA